MKAAVKRSLRHIGMDVIRWRPQSSPEAALGKMLAAHEIDTVLDVGANEGQYARLLREVGFSGRIISFEPLTSAHERLRQLAASDSLWTIAPRAAVGNEEGEVTLNVASNGASSSLLRLLDTHRSAAPEVQYVGFDVAPIRPLDHLACQFLDGSRNMFLKIDVQGYELPVLKGATDVLRRTSGVQLELSFIPLYEGQTLFSELIDWMAAKGFAVWGIVPGLVDGSTGRMLQVDAVFFRT